MRFANRIAVQSSFAVLCAVATLIWVRSYWRVDKVWVQVLPKIGVEARLTPGQVSVRSTRSTVRLPLGDSHWFSWPVDNYFAESIPPPTNTLLSEFRIYNGVATIPLWFLTLLSSLPLVAVLMRPLVLKALESRFKRTGAQRTAIASEIPVGSLLHPNQSLIAAGQTAPDLRTVSVMPVVS